MNAILPAASNTIAITNAQCMRLSAAACRLIDIDATSSRLALLLENPGKNLLRHRRRRMTPALAVLNHPRHRHRRPLKRRERESYGGAGGAADFCRDFPEE